MKSICFYHDDADGIMSGAIVLKNEPGIQCYKINYGYDREKFLEYMKGKKFEKIYIVDFSFETAIMQSLNAKAKDIIWIDHHISAKEKYPVLWNSKAIHGIRDIRWSGAWLTWQYFHPDIPTPMSVQWVDDWDRWQFLLEDTKPFHEAFELRYWKPEDVESFIFEPSNVRTAMMLNEGKVLSEAKQKRIGKVFDMGYDLHIFGYVARVINTPHDISDSGNYALTKGYQLAIIYNIGQTIASVSLRSKSKVDVSKIAEKYGGGGHKNAAGFRIENDKLWKILT